MKVAINCRSFLKKQYTGIGRYTFNLVQSLSEIDQENEYWLYARKGLLDRKRSFPRPPCNNFTVKADVFNRGLNKVLNGADIYHSPSPDFLDINNTKIIVTIQDLIHITYPEGHTKETIEIAEKQVQEAVLKADKIICGSHSTEIDLKKYFEVPDEKTTVVHHGIDKQKFYPIESQHLDGVRAGFKKSGVDKPFLLFVGTIEPRKNLANFLEAFRIIKSKYQYPGQLVVIGMKGWMIEKLERTLATLENKDDVIFLGYVTDEELRNYYNCCDAFIFPSFYEGFGFPLVEAFSCGAAVVTSNVSSCAEVATESALQVDPASVDQMAQTVAEVLGNEELRKDLKRRALIRAKDFSFLKTAQQTLDVYRDVYHHA